MSEPINLRETVVPKSTQLNADDLIGVSKTITITKVTRGDSDQPVSIHYENDNGRPYLPCKSMRRVLIHAWGDDGRQWVGRSMTLYCDPEVKFGGVKVGGIRISHVSHIERPMIIALTVTKAKRAEYRVDPLETAKTWYPDDKFAENLPAWVDLIAQGKASIGQIAGKCRRTGELTDEQMARLSDEVAALNAA